MTLEDRLAMTFWNLLKERLALEVQLEELKGAKDAPKESSKGAKAR